MNLIIGIVVGYMYKVQKNKLPITKFKEHFAAVRHGDYIEFLNLINKKIYFIVVYNKGTIDNNVSINEEDFDFLKILKGLMRQIWRTHAPNMAQKRYPSFF